MKNVVQDLTSAGLLGVWGKWMKHAKYIYNIQDFNPEQVLAVGYTKSKLVTDAMMWFDKFSCKRSDLVITVGRDLVETVENRFRGKKVPKTVMINNWIDENEIYPLDENNERVVAFKKKYGLDGKFVIMYSGNIGLYYDLENLIKVVEKIKVGTKTADGRDSTEALCKELNYSIHDAIEAGFNHVVFIIRKDIEKEFKEVIGDRIAAICSAHNVTVDYAFQDIKNIPGTLPEGRTKPWGTGQAVLAAKKVIKTPFIVINADDYYGKEGFKAVYEYLINGGKSCMAGFVLKNTLSDNGGVTRGICKMDENGNLTEVVETKNIVKTAIGAETDGVAVDVNSLVSMNMWGLTPDFLEVLEQGFKEFFEKEVPENPLKAEYLIPIFIGELLEQGKMSVKVLKTNDTWYGMTYHEDVAAVKESFQKMLEEGVYQADLFSDL